MSVPFTGALLIAIGISFFFFAPKLLYGAMIVSIPFSATAVANVRWGGEDKGIAAWLFLGLLWVFRESLSTTPLWHRSGWFLSRKARVSLAGFLMAVIASLSVPLLLNGTSWIPSPNLPGTEALPVQFGWYDLTQTAYLALGIFLAVFVGAENFHSSRLSYTLKLYVSGCVFAAGWGLFELWCNLTGRTYPAYLFNTNSDISALGYQQILALGGGNLARVSSVALEPSVLSEELLLAFVVLLVYRGLGKHLLSPKWDYIALALISIALLVSTSSTAYAGILMAVLLAGFSLYRAGRLPKGYVVSVTLLLGGVTLAVETVPFVAQLGTMLVLNKLETGSGMVRTQSVLLAAQDFFRFPVLGAGWHTVPCWDFLFLLLSNTGLVGLSTFMLFLVPVLRDLWSSTGNGRHAAVVLLPTVALMVILAEAAGLTYAAGYPWLIFGLGSGAAIAARRSIVSADPAGKKVRTVPRFA